MHGTFLAYIGFIVPFLGFSILILFANKKKR